MQKKIERMSTNELISVRLLGIDLVFNTVNLSFKIHKAANKTTGDDDDDDDDIPCNVVVEAYQGTNLETWQWYDRQCTGSEYWVSWGYMADSDAGIMTLVRYVIFVYFFTACLLLT